MNPTDITRQTIWEDGDVTEMARFEVAGSNGTQSDVSTITRNIFDESSSTPRTAIASDSLTVSSVVFDTLQTDDRWSEDSTGYNFRDRIAGSNFATGEHTYRVEYAFVGANNEAFPIVFQHPAQELYSS